MQNEGWKGHPPQKKKKSLEGKEGSLAGSRRQYEGTSSFTHSLLCVMAAQQCQQAHAIFFFFVLYRQRLFEKEEKSEGSIPIYQIVST